MLDRIALAPLFLGLVVAAPALSVGPVIDYGTFSGTTVTFGDSGGVGVTEQTQSTGDPDTLYGAPLLVGDSLVFFPPAFSSVAAGGASDTTESLLSMQITGNGPSDAVSMISLSEFGDTILSGTGTAATGSSASLSGTVTVLEDASGPIVPIVIPFSGTFSPSSTFDLVANPGVTNWSGGIMIDVAATVADATVVVLDLTNLLTSSSEATSSASISKKVVAGPVVAISVLPEPTCDLEIDKTCCIPEPKKTSDGEDVCDGKAVRAVFEITGGQCGKSTNHQYGKLRCMGHDPIVDPASDVVTITTPWENDLLINGMVPPVVVDLAVSNAIEVTHTSGQLERATRIKIDGPGGKQFIKLSTSCYKPLRCEDQFGALKLVELESTLGGTVDCFDDTQTATNCAMPSGSIGTMCDAKLTEAVFRFTPKNCQNPLPNPQNGEATCTGDASDANLPVSVTYTGKKRTKVHVTPSSGIQSGDLVHVSSTGWKAGLFPNLELLIEDEDSVEQTLELHVSCSQPLACGDKFGSLELVGFKTKTGFEVDCQTAPAPVFQDSCEVPAAPPKPHCKGSLEEIQLVYLGELFGSDCSVSNAQGGDASCTGDNLTDDGVGVTVSTAGVDADPDVDINVRGVFSIEPSNSWETLPGTVTFTATDGVGNTQTVTIRTDCEEPLDLGDRFGDFAVFGLDRGDGNEHNGHYGCDSDSDSDSDSDEATGKAGEDGLITLGGVIEYQYKVTNPNDHPVDVSVEDDPNTADGDPTTVPVGTASLAPGEMATFFLTRTLFESTTNLATVSGDDTMGGMCTPAQDTVDATVVLPPTGSFDCWKAKPIDEISLEWAGAQDVCVVAYDGAIGVGPVLDTIDGVAPGDVVTVGGLGGYPLVQEWEIFAAGDCGGTPLGASEFKISCHDPSMNGVEDCRQNEGNGKDDDPALINDWLLEGMAGDEVLECTPVVIPPSGGGGGCGLGFELMVLLPGAIWLYGRRRRRTA